VKTSSVTDYTALYGWCFKVADRFIDWTGSRENPRCTAIATGISWLISMAKRRSPRSAKTQALRFNTETERETDGRRIAEIADIPGVLAFGRTENQAKANA